MEYFNAGGGGASGNGAIDPYSVIPQQFGNGGQPPPQQQQMFADYQQDGVSSDYDSYQQSQQQYRSASQAPQQSPSMYYQNQMQGSYFPIHSASEHDFLTDFLGPQQPPTGASSAAAGSAVPYQSGGGSSKEFMMQHQQRRGNQSGQQQGQQAQHNSQQQNQSGRQQMHQPQQQQQPNQYMHHQQLQAVQQQQAQQMHHRLHGAPINPQQFMVPPPTMMQPQQIQQAQQQQQVQQQVQQIHQMQMHHQQHSQMMQQQQPHQQQQASQQGYHSHQQNQQQRGGHGSHNQSQMQHHHNQSGHQHIQQFSAMPQRPMLRDWPIRCVIEGKYHSVIVGPNGATIKEISHSSHCRVDFVNLSKRERAVLGNNDRILNVHGAAEQASKAVARILEVIQNEALKDDVNVGADTVLRLRAHNQLCGRLIGKAGSSIKEIMQKTGTNITVTKYIEPPGGLTDLRPDELLSLMERTIIVRGPSIDAVIKAESHISAKLKKCYETDSQLRAQSMGMIPPFIMPPIGAPGIPSSSSAVQPPTVYPGPMGLAQVQHFAPRAQNAQHSTSNNSFLQPGVLQIAPGVSTLRQVRMWVPDSMIGALIGAKGKNIKMIIRETGAQVKIEAPEEKVQREAEEAEKKGKNKKMDESESGGAAGSDENASGDHPQEFMEDNGTVTSADAIEEKPKPVPERMVTINGDDLQLLKAQSFVFAKIAETTPNLPNAAADFDRIMMLRIRTEVSVPTRIIGRIIGKGGQNVRELQRITGAVVKIPEEERNGGDVLKLDDGQEEDLTMIRTVGNMHSTHNVQFRLAHLVGEYFRSGEYLQKAQEHKGARPHSAPSGPEAGNASSSLDRMGQLAQVSPFTGKSNRSTPKSTSPPKSKSP